MHQTSKGNGFSGEGIHLMVFPYPAQGHMLPLLDLTHQLALQDFTITIVVTPKNLPFLSPLLSTHPSLHSLVLPLPHHPSLPEGVEHVSAIGNSGNSAVISALSRLHDPIADWFRSHSSPPAAIISDFFLGWTVGLARTLKIPRVGFYSSGAFLVSITDHLSRNLEACASLDEVEFPDLPGSPSLKQYQLPSLYRRFQESDLDWEIVRAGMPANGESWGFVFNSFDALECEYLRYLKKTYRNERVYGVGPLNSGRIIPISNSDVLRWLDGHEADSVLYVCFGSQKLLRTRLVEALAEGLHSSGIPFVWVIKPETQEGNGSIPDGFEDRVGRSGLVIKGWAPQVEILGHPSVGGFLSHCGWNSVLEAVTGGVMILAWPMEADQFVNAKLLVDRVGSAVLVWEGDDIDPDPAHITDIIRKSMTSNAPQREKMKEMQTKAIEAIHGGTSTRDFNKLINELVKLQK